MVNKCIPFYAGLFSLTDPLMGFTTWTSSPAGGKGYHVGSATCTHTLMEEPSGAVCGTVSCPRTLWHLNCRGWASLINTVCSVNNTAVIRLKRVVNNCIHPFTGYHWQLLQQHRPELMVGVLQLLGPVGNTSLFRAKTVKYIHCLFFLEVLLAWKLKTNIKYFGTKQLKNNNKQKNK